MIHQLLVDRTIDFLMSVGKKAILKIDGIEKEFDFYRVDREGNVIKKYVYLSTEIGTVTDARVVDELGRNLESYTSSIEKGPDGFMIVFYLKLNIEGAVAQ